MPGCRRLLAGLGGKKIAFEASDMTVATHQQMKKSIASLAEAERPQLVPTPNLVESLRLFKEPGEIEALQRAVDLGDAACHLRIASASSPAGPRSRSPGRSRSTSASTAATACRSTRSSPAALGSDAARLPARPQAREGRGRRHRHGLRRRRLHVRPDAHDLPRQARRPVQEDLRHRAHGAAHRGGDGRSPA